MTLAGTLSELIVLLLALGLTLLVYSYVVGDNPLYRLSVHLLVGVAAGYAVVLVVQEVIAPVLSEAVADPVGAQGRRWLLPLLLAALLLFKLSARLPVVGNSAMAVLMAVGAAVALSGAVTGTLVPLVTTGPGGFGGVLAALLTALALAYFFYSRPRLAGGRFSAAAGRYLRLGGRVVITVALAGIFAGLINTGLILLAERVSYFYESFSMIIGG